MYKQKKINIYCLLIFLILLSLSHQYSDVTLLHCSSSYLSSSPVQNQNGLIDFGSTLYSAYQSVQNKQSLKKIIIQGDLTQLSNYMSSVQIPFVIIGIVFVLIIMATILWCLFSRSCPPWEWTKRDLITHPYTPKQMRFTLFWLILFAVATLIISVLIIAEIPKLKTNMSSTQCSFFVTVDTAINGNTKSWTGFSGLKNNVGNISSLISSTMTQIGLYFTGNQWLVDDMTVMKTKNNQIYSENKDAQLVSSNPATTAVQRAAGFPAPLIDSLFIRTGMGPVGQGSTMTTQIQVGLNVTQNLSLLAYSIDQSSSLISASVATIQSNLAMAQNTLSMYIHQLQSYLTYIEQLSQTYFVGQFSTFLYVIQVIIAIMLIGTLLMLIGAFSTAIFQILDCRKMVHIAWIIYSLSFLGALALLYLFIGFGSVGYSFCNYYQGFLQGGQVFAAIKGSNSQNILNRFDSCLYGNGNVLESFSVDSQIQTLTQLYTYIKTYKDYTSLSSGNYINKTYSIDTLNKWIDTIQKYRLGILIDSNPVETNDDNPNYAIKQLNKYTNTNGVVPCSKDVWVFDIADCKNTTQDTYHTSDSTNGAYLNPNKVSCISFNEGFQKNISTNQTITWTQQSINKRYIQIRQTCPVTFNKINQYAGTLISFRDSRKNLFQGIQDSLNEILVLNSNFNSQLSTFQSQVSQFADSTKTLNNLLISQSTGINYVSNCSIIGSKMKDTYTIFCRNFMSQIVRMGIYSIFLIVCLAFGIWTGSLFAVRYSQIQKHQRLNMPQSQVHSQRVMSDKKSSDSD